MNAQEQITGILNLLDHARSVTVSGKPVSIKRDDFEQYPDYEAILEKLAQELSVIKIVQYPEMDDVDYQSNIGFISDAELNAAISYQIEVLPKFEALLDAKKGVSQTETLHTTVLLSGNKVLLSLSDGTQIELKTLRTDMPKHEFMRYVLANPKVYTKASSLDPAKHNFAGQDMTELARQCGFNTVLKRYFFPDTTKDRVHFVQEADVPVEVISNLRTS